MKRFFTSNSISPVDISHKLNTLKLHQQAIKSPTLKNEIEPANINQPETYIYAVGYIHAKFPNLSLEKEFNQAKTLADKNSPLLPDVNDDVALAHANRNKNLNSELYGTLIKPENNYIAREMNWTFSNSDGNETYKVIPPSHQGLYELISALAPNSSDKNKGGNDVAQQVIIIGVESRETDSLAFSHIIPVSQESITQSISQAAGTTSINNTYMTELVSEILSLNGNDGYNHGDRALNYALYNNWPIYQKAYELLYASSSNGPNPNGYQLVNVRILGDSSSNRLVAKLVFDFQGINTGASQSWYCAVDVSGEYPFLLTDMARFLARD
jgi:hypothetical protein